jgi:hypothetical protein
MPTGLVSQPLALNLAPVAKLEKAALSKGVTRISRFKSDIPLQVIWPRPPVLDRSEMLK